jgi:hypothetical protein
MQHIAEAGGAQYVWIEPEGIYPAMVTSLDLVPQQSYVWWINSSDWLAGANSVQHVSNHLEEKEGQHVSWLVGQLIRLKQDKISFHDSGFSGQHFVNRMSSGGIGFPHPSTIFWLPDLRQVSPFSGNLKVASDYATALRFAKKFGSPEMSPVALSVHTPTGFSANRPVQNVFDKSRARLSVSSGIEKAFEPLRTATNAARGVLNLLTKNLGGRSFLPNQVFPLGANEHFCLKVEDSVWPDCCDNVLENPFVHI